MIVEAMKPAILVVDDDHGCRESLRMLLKKEFTVLAVDSVRRALHELPTFQPDAVIMDLIMPRTSGFDGLRKIRARDPDVAMIVATGSASFESAQEALRLGASDFIRKPFDVSEMLASVRRAVQRTENQRRRGTALREVEELNRRLLTELAGKERLATMGLRSAELVHDLRNPLGLIMGYTDLLAERLRGKDGESGEYLDAMQKNAMRCKRMVDAWLTVGRPGMEAREPVRLDLLAHEVVDGLHPLAKDRRVRLRLFAASGHREVLGSPMQLVRVLQNLVLNAIDAVPAQTGRIDVECEDVGDEVVVRVRDNGCGIPSDRAASVFEPFVTSKEAGRGTGLGLYISKRFVEDHGGRIAIESVEGQGTTVTVILPARAAALRPVPAGSPADGS